MGLKKKSSSGFGGFCGAVWNWLGKQWTQHPARSRVVVGGAVLWFAASAVKATGTKALDAMDRSLDEGGAATRILYVMSTGLKYVSVVAAADSVRNFADGTFSGGQSIALGALAAAMFGVGKITQKVTKQDIDDAKADKVKETAAEAEIRRLINQQLNEMNKKQM